MARILVVDDEEGIRVFLSESLQRDGHVITEAADGEAALQELSSRAFDLMITDLRMPKIDGMELIRRVTRSRTSTAFIQAMGLARLSNC